MKGFSRFFLFASLFVACGITTSGCSSHRAYYNINHGKKYVSSINSWGNYDVKGKTFYIGSASPDVKSNDLEFKEYSTYLAEDLHMSGAILTDDYTNADICVLMNYGIADASYTELVPIPIFGPTSISSINTTSYTDGSGYGTAYSTGNTVFGYGTEHTTTNTNTSVNYHYGITGYHNVSRRVNNYDRYVNIYAFDNKDYSESPAMLWKTNIVSSGSSGDLRTVIQFMLYSAWNHLGNSTNSWQTYQVFDDDYMFKCWKDKGLTNENVTIYPTSFYSNAFENFEIVYVERLPRETVVCIKKTGCQKKYSFSPRMYIECGELKAKVVHAERYELGKIIRQECGNHYFRLHFPIVFKTGNTFDLVEYLNKKETKKGLEWKKIKVH